MLRKALCDASVFWVGVIFLIFNAKTHAFESLPLEFDDSSAKEVITVTSAIWSGEKVTDKAGSYCNGKYSCNYKVSTAYIGEAKNPAQKNFKITYHCGNPALTKTEVLPHDATDKRVVLDCALLEPREPFPDPKSAIWKASRYKRSFRSMILNDRQEGVEKDLSEACIASLKKIYNNGRTLQSAYLEKMVKEVDLRDLDDKDLVFYHYTPAQEVMKLVKEKRWMRIFDYLRTLDGISGTYSWHKVSLYIAADPESSKDKGPIRLDIKIRKSARVFEEKKISYSEIESRLSTELNAKYRELLRECNFWYLYPYILEDSGVDLLYYGEQGENDPAAHQWFQIINPYAVESITVGAGE